MIRRLLNKPVLRAVLGLAVVAGLGGALAVVAGLIPIKASSGHWPVTAWFLHFTMRSGV